MVAVAMNEVHSAVKAARSLDTIKRGAPPDDCLEGDIKIVIGLQDGGDDRQHRSPAVRTGGGQVPLSVSWDSPRSLPGQPSLNVVNAAG